MRRIEFLSDQVRRATDNRDTNAITNSEIAQYFNDAQDRIYSLVFQKMPESNIFVKTANTDLVSGTAEYTLPTDIYAVNAVNAVYVNYTGSATDDSLTALKRLSDHEETLGFGYSLRKNTIRLTPPPTGNQSEGLRILYTEKLPTLGFREGSVDSFVSGVSITLAAGGNEDINTRADFITVIDRDGAVKQSGIRVTGQAGLVISTDTTLTDVAAGDFVVIGEYATTNSFMPNECERFLLDYVQSKLYMRESSTDISVQKIFSDEIEDEIVGLFANNVPDALQVPIIESDWLIY